MNTNSLIETLPTLWSELVDGAPANATGTYMLNLGDAGLLRSLDALSASEASATAQGGASIAAHAEHLRYGLSLMNRWATGAQPNLWADADWTVAWRIATVSENAWRELRDDLRREAERWLNALRQPREVTDRELNVVVGTVAHLAYHLGAIRQIARAARGPTAEDELKFKAR